MAGNDAFTKLLLHANGTDGSTTYIDSSASSHSITAGGNAQIDTAQSKFGGASSLHDGSIDYLLAPADADFNQGTGDWTIDFWIRYNAAGNKYVFDNTPQTLTLIVNTTGNVNLFHAGIGNVINGGATAFNLNQWYHLAIVRFGTDFRCYRDGVSYASGTSGSGLDFGSSTDPFYVGDYSGLAAGFGTDGWIDEFRLSKGIARWTADFTPSTEEYSVDAPPAFVVFSDQPSIKVTHRMIGY